MTTAESAHGCLLGLAVGDALGALTRGQTGPDIFRRFGLFEQMLTRLTDSLPVTNATLHTLAVANHLATHGTINAPALLTELAAQTDWNRLSNPATFATLTAVLRGENPRMVADLQSNAAADAVVRSIPLALIGREPDTRRADVRATVRLTHTDPLVAEGAEIFTAALAEITDTTHTWNRREFFKRLSTVAQSEEYQWALRTASKLKRTDSVAVLGNGPDAARCVVTAIACFAATPDDFDLAVGRALGLGGATDSLAALTAALCGAVGGVKVIPHPVIRRLDPGHLPTTTLELATRLSPQAK